MAATSNVIDLADYRARKAQFQPDSQFAPMMMPMMMAWFPVWFVPMMPAQNALASGQA